MKNIQREDIYNFSRNSNLSETAVDKALKEHIYHDREDWSKFLRLFLVTLGIGFTVAGVVFFFAYNWEDLHKFVKLGLVQGLVILSTALVFLPRFSIQLRKIILTASTMLVGVLFAVFGQIYQTGADAYDFFLVWTLFVTVWVILSDFAPLWLIYLILINTTLVLYSQQVANDWTDLYLFTLLFIINVAAFILFLVLPKLRSNIAAPGWLMQTIALAATVYATLGIVFGILMRFEISLLLSAGLVSFVYAVAIIHGLRSKNVFFLSIVPLSVIVMLSTLFVHYTDDFSIFFFIALFIIVSVTVLIRTVIKLQIKWANEK